MLCAVSATLLAWERSSRKKSLKTLELAKVEAAEVDPSGRTCLVSALSDFGFHKKIFARSPLAVNRLTGAMIYPHLD
jgi:hypothetical protein